MNNKLWLALMALFFVLLLLVGMWSYMLGMSIAGKGFFAGPEARLSQEVTKKVRVLNLELPLKGGVLVSGTPHSARMKLGLAVAPADMESLKAYLPFIVDSLQVYMNKITGEQMKADQHLRGLRADLLREANRVSGPVHISDVHVRELMIQ